jgi:hypothetical protein
VDVADEDKQLLSIVKVNPGFTVIWDPGAIFTLQLIIERETSIV